MQDIFWEFGLPVVSHVYVYLYTINPLLTPHPLPNKSSPFQRKKVIKPPPHLFQEKKVIKPALSFKPPLPTPFILK